MENIDFAFLDSGTGGIPYMLYLRKKLPDSYCAYLGDTAHFPYGQKSPEQILECASEAVSLILKKWNPKTVVIGCNTISVTALAELRKCFPSTPIVGTVPAIKLAASVSKNKRIGLLATNATINHPYCKNLIDEFASDCTVFKRGDPELISFVEKKLFTSSEKEKFDAISPALNFFKENDCDTIILGCTHFTHLAEEFKKLCGEKIQIVDSRDGVARQAIRVEEKCLEESAGKNLQPENLKTQSFAFFVTKADSSEENEYKILCKNLNIPWGGILSL